jgi:predicted Zn finger-like uncharacterized protein
MKFVCSHCASQYLISDDKIGPKGVKIKCQRCSSIILVKPESLFKPEEPKETQAQDVAENQDMDGGSENQSDDVAEAFDHLLQAKLGDEADDWQSQATEVFQMRKHHSALEEQSEKQKDIDQVFSDAESTQLELPEVGEEETLTSDWYAAVNDQQLGPIDLSELESIEDLYPHTLVWHPSMTDWTALQNVPQLRHLTERLDQQPEWSQEESTLSSLLREEMSSGSAEENNDDELAFEQDEDVSDREDLPPWQQDSIQGPEQQNSPAEKAPALGTDSYFTGDFTNNRVLAGPAYLGSKRKFFPMKWMVVALVGCVVLGSFFWIALRPEEKDVDAFGLAQNKASPAAGPLSGWTQRLKKPASAEQGALPPAKPEKPEPSEMVVQRPSLIAKVKIAKKETHPKHVVTRKKRVPKKKDLPAPGIPKKLSSFQVGQAMKKHIGELRSCSQQQQQRDPGITGTLRISFVISSEGRVPRITIKSREHRGSFVANCIALVIKSIRFPKAKEPFNVPDLPIKLGG